MSRPNHSETHRAAHQDGGAPTTVLLAGPEAVALVSRLALSGYCPVVAGDAGAPPPDEAPGAMVLAPEAEGRIAEFRHRFPGVPLLLGVRCDSLEGRVRCLARGADDFWITTLGPSDLLTRLRLHLGLNRAEVPPAITSPAPLQVADLWVDTSTQEVRRGSRPIQLTAREYELLLLLLRSSGTVVSRERISAIWQEERAAASNVIEVYVRYLRQKLEQGGERRLIHTVRGQGYCLGDRLPGRPESV